MIRLELKHGEPIDKALRRFKKICDREGITRDMRKHAYYEKPCEQKKRREREQQKERAKAVRLANKKKVKTQRARVKALKKARGGPSSSSSSRSGPSRGPGFRGR